MIIRQEFLFSIVFSCILNLLQAQSEVGDKAPRLVIDKISEIPNSSREGMEGPTVTVLDFWATWCSPCVAQLPDLETLNNQFSSKGVKFVAISNENKDRVKSFLKSRSFSFDVAIDSSNVSFESYNISTLPQSFIIDKEGIIQYRGSHISADMLDQVISTGRVIAPATMKQSFFTKDNVVIDGGWRPGQDPVFNGVQIMLAGDNVDFEDPLEQVIFRKSLESERGGYGTRTTTDYVGITYGGGTASDIFSFLLDLTSTRWLKNNLTDPAQRYDLVYWKPSKSLQDSKTEVVDLIQRGLNAELLTEESELEMQVLTSSSDNTHLLSSEDLSNDNKFDYQSIHRVLIWLEKRGGDRYTHELPYGVTHLFAPNGIVKFGKMKLEEIIEYLNSIDIEIVQKSKVVESYVLNPIKKADTE